MPDPIEKCALDPRQLAEDAVAMVEERASTKNLSLSFQCEAIPQAVIGDPLRIQGQVQVIEQLHAIARQMDIDWEEPVAMLFGDIRSAFESKAALLGF